MLDVCSYVGPYPFRELPHPDPATLARVLEREGIRGAWVGWLPAPWQRDPAEGNAALRKALAGHPTLRAVPVVRPDWPAWEALLDEAVEGDAPAIRVYPAHWGLGPQSGAMRDLAIAAGEAGLPILLTVRFEDLRQRSPLDAASDLSAAAIRAVIRASPDVHVVVAGAGREMIEEVHWSLTVSEQARLWWDFAWVWGPPEDHLAHLFRTIGGDRFVLGLHWPLRIVQGPLANLEILPDDLAGVRLADADDILERARAASA